MKAKLESPAGYEGIRTTKDSMAKGRDERFLYVHSAKSHYKATLLDPRFKDQLRTSLPTKYHDNDHIAESATAVRQEDENVTQVPTTSDSSIENEDVEANNTMQLEGQSNSPKRKQFNIWDKTNIESY